MKSWKKVVGAVCMTTLVAAAVAGCGKSGGKSGGGDTIKVGALFELTGNVANYGTSTLNGFKMAVDEVNAKGGVNGKKIEVVQADNKSEPSESGNAATKLVTQDKVVAVVGPATSGSVAAAEPILTAHKKPQSDHSLPLFMARCAPPPAITLGKDGKAKPYVFRACFIDPYQGKIMAEFAAKDLKLKKIAILNDSSSDYSKGLAEVFEKTFTENGRSI